MMDDTPDDIKELRKTRDMLRDRGQSLAARDQRAFKYALERAALNDEILDKKAV